MKEQDVAVRRICTQWISDGIGEDYKGWSTSQPPVSASRIFIESPTGTGKTSFVLDRLFPYAAERGRNILYLGNRTALEEQTKYAVEKRLTRISVKDDDDVEGKDLSEIRTFQYPDSCSAITILNYQSVLGFTKQLCSPFGSKPFYYVILDEVHFFLEDALFNPTTWKILERIMQCFYDSALIFMSATMEESVQPLLTILDSFRPTHPQERIYQNFYHWNQTFYINSYRGVTYHPCFFNRYEEIVQRIKISPPHEKWLIFVSSKREGQTLEKDIKTRTARKVTFLTADKKEHTTWKRLINESSFEENILIVTKVLDNGANIIDPAVKHIVLPFCDRIDFLQMLGRRRTGSGEALSVYARYPTIQTVNSQLRQIKLMERAMQPFIPVAPSGEAMTQLLQDYWMRGEQSINNLFYIDSKRNLVLNPLAHYKVKLLKQYYIDLAELNNPSLYYPHIVYSWLGLATTGLPDYLSIDNFSSLDHLLAAYLNRPIPEEERERFYQNFQHFYKIRCVKQFGEGTTALKQALTIRKGKTQRKLTINKSLAMLDLPYQIVKRENCWVLERI